jgi:hypothetical protein
MPKRLLKEDQVWKGEIITVARDDRGQPVETEVEVPEDFPQSIGRDPSMRRRQSAENAGNAGNAESTPTMNTDNEQTTGGAGGGNAGADYESMTKVELEALIEARGLGDNVQGSGANGNVLKQDLIDALSAAEQQGGQGGQLPPAA